MQSTTADWPDRYERFQRCLLLHDTVVNGTIYPRWVGQSDQFWYDRAGDSGVEYCIVDATAAKKWLCFTLAAVARVLSETLGSDIDPSTLILKNLQITLAPERAIFEAFGESWAYEVGSSRLERVPQQANRDWLVSPDGTQAAFLRDGNLWIREIASGMERALTVDGTHTYAYSDAPTSMRAIRARIGNAPEASWSPDSKRLLTLQTDERHVPELALMEYAPLDGLRPKVHVNKTSLPPDDRPTEFRILSIDVDTGRQTEAQHPRLSAVRMNDTVFAAGLAWWSADGQTAYFVDVERGERTANLIAFDVITGATRVVFSETAATHVDLGVNLYAPALVFPLPESNEVIWFSERTGHGHLYLYDVVTGALKRSITCGLWQVRDVQHIDATRREVFFTAAGIAPDEGPYVCKPCSASLDENQVVVLSAAPGEHIVWRRNEHLLYGLSLLGGNRRLVSGLAPSGNYFVETTAGIDRLPTTELRRRSGDRVMVIETAHDRSLPADWQWPERVRLKAADGITEVYGLLFKPPGYDSRQSYPLIDFVYGAAHMAFVPTSAFADGGIISTYGQAAGYASLGAFCLVLDGRGTAYRERAFRDASYGAVQTTSNLEDHIAGIRQLAQHHPIDLDRIGITGFSGGGYLAALAALRYGHFFKVAVAGGGNYDQTLFWHCWSERYQGPYSPSQYEPQAVKYYADGLTGKLLLIHGLMDSGCHPTALFQLIQALIERNKDVDLVLMPRTGHELTGYGQRRLIDYFVTHLFGAVPPKSILITTPFEQIAQKLRANAQPPQRIRLSAGEIEHVVLHTPLGRLLAEVYVRKAPISSAGFLRFVDQGTYDGAAFVRVVRPDNDAAEPKIEVVQASVANFEAASSGLDHETTVVTGIKHVDGTLSLARLSIGTGTPATFFICVGDQPNLDFGGLRNPDGQGFAAFGRIIEGMDIVRRIQQLPTRPDAPVEQLVGQMLTEPVPILSVQRVNNSEQHHE
jgi:dipeptidyl aminopeptidase/acylaminoacyl peptidase/cyclophilin family peptidyl-prolyl cis-trans isomerase